MGLSLRNDGSSSLTQDAMPGGKISEEVQPEPVPYYEGPVWKKHANRLLEGLHLVHRQKALAQSGSAENPTQTQLGAETQQPQPKIEIPVGAGTGGELKG